MKIKRISLWTVLVVVATVATCRLVTPRWDPQPGYGILTWDVFGYYLYLPATFIYDDLDKLEFVPELIDKYEPTATFYQVNHLENGNKVMKYTMGLSIMYSPFFFAGHAVASLSDYPVDGLSVPYQFSIAISAVFYLLLGLLVLRKVLLRYFSENVSAFTLLIIGLGTNLLQFTAFDGAMPHSYLFTLYALILWNTIRWHEAPKLWRGGVLGLLIGLAALIRPSEAISILIPVLWGVRGWPSLKEKFALLWQHKFHVLALALGIFIAGLPQLLYWKSISGDFLHYTYGGEGFVFNRPQLMNVLFSFKKGWLIYTPLMVFAIVGFVALYKRNRELFWTLFVFFVLNTYVISSWSNWWYASSLGHRAFIQSYAVMALPLAAFLTWIYSKRNSVRIGITVVITLLFSFNLFQHYQYSNFLIDPYRMTAEYYWNIFLKTNGAGVDRSLLETEEFHNPYEEYIHDDNNFHKRTFSFLEFEDEETRAAHGDAISTLQKFGGEHAYKMDSVFIYSPGIKTEMPAINGVKGSWVRATCQVYPTATMWESPASLVVTFESMGKSFKYAAVGLDSMKVEPNQWNEMRIECIIPNLRYSDDVLKVFVFNQGKNDLFVDDLKVEILEPKK